MKNANNRAIYYVLRMQRFSFYDYLLAFISIATYFADVATDIFLIIYFFNQGQQVWGSLTLSFVALAAIVMQVFSFHWHVSDRTLTVGSLIVHILFLAPLHRYLRVFHLGHKSRRSGNTDDLSAAYREINDISILRLIEAFVESVPQLMLQVYIVLTNLQNFNTLIGFSIVFSLLSVSWSITAYNDALHLVYKKLYKRSFISMLTHVLWQTGMVTARVASIVLVATVFHGYVGIPLGVHFIVMIIWINKLEPEFGTTPCERRLFTVVSAAIHTFCFVNVKDGPSRYRMVFYYIVTMVEMAVFMTVWYWCKVDTGPIWFDATAFSVVFGSFGLGTIFVLLYYGCCHPSGPAPMPSKNADFLKPGHMRFGEVPHPYKPSLPSHKPQGDKQMNWPSKTNHPSIFDVTSTSARINLWLSASLDLSKEGLVDNPDRLIDGSLQLSRDEINESRLENISDERNLSCMQTPVDVHVSPLGSACSNRSAKPLTHTGRPHQLSYVDQGSYRERSQSELNGTDDKLDFSHASRMTEREQSMPDYNIVEMFARCKFDPSFVSDSSISDILFNQTLKQNMSVGGREKYSLSPENQSGRTILEQHKSQSDIACRHWSQSRTSNDSSKSFIYSAKSTPDRQMTSENGPVNISPLDPSKLWEESVGRLGVTPSMKSLLGNAESDPALHRSVERSTVLTVTPDNSRGITHLSLSYSDMNSDNTLPKRNTSRNRDNSTLSETADSFVFRHGVNKSIESLNNSNNFVNESELLSFSDVSLQLPDSSSKNALNTRPDILQCTSARDHPHGHEKNMLPEKYGSRNKYPVDRNINSRSVDSFSSREYSPSDRQSSYLSDRGLASDRGLSSSHSSNDASGHRSLTSSGFQSEESPLSTTSPMYGYYHYEHANEFQSTPIVENEISSICPTSSATSEITKRVCVDEDVYADSSRQKYSTPGIEERNTPIIQQALKDDITPVTCIDPNKPHMIMPPSSLFYVEKSNCTDSPVLPPLGWSRRSSSTGSSSSGGRFFKDPTADDCDGPGENKSDEDSKYPQSVASNLSTSAFLEKSSLSVLLSDMSSSKCTRTSEETMSLASDPDSLRRSSRSNLSWNAMRKAESLPYMPKPGQYDLDKSETGKAANLPYPNYTRRSLNRSQTSIHEYENINNFSSQSACGSTSSLNLSSGKTVSSYLCNTEPEKHRLQELYDEYSQVARSKNADKLNKTFDKGTVPDYVNVNELSGDVSDEFHNLRRTDYDNDMFNRDHNWRASLDQEMRDRLVSDIEKLAPKKLYQLHSKNGMPGKKLSPVNISEYSESPYKFRKSNGDVASADYENIDSLGNTNLSEYAESPYKVRKSASAARRTVYDGVRSDDKESLSGEYENIDSVAAAAGVPDNVNINHLLAACPVASPESLSDAVFLDDISAPYKQGDVTFNRNNDVRCELYQEPMYDEGLQLLDLSRTRSPINTSGVNSAFRPVKGRKSVESELSRSSGGPDLTYAVGDKLDDNNRESMHVSKDTSIENGDRSSKLGQNSIRQSNASQNSSDIESMLSFQWSRNTGLTSMTGLSDSAADTPRNYLQLAGKAPLSFSVPSFLRDDVSSQSSKHSYTDSIPWEEADGSLQTTADLSGVKPFPRQPLKALENTPVFSPIYGQDTRLDTMSVELSSRKRFMSTPKLSSCSEMGLSDNSENSMAMSNIKTPHRRGSGVSKQAYLNNTSTWSSHSESDVSNRVNEHSTFSALSKTTYI